MAARTPPPLFSVEQLLSCTCRSRHLWFMPSLSFEHRLVTGPSFWIVGTVCIALAITFFVGLLNLFVLAFRRVSRKVPAVKFLSGNGLPAALNLLEQETQSSPVY